MKIETFIRKPTKVKYALSVLNEQYAEFYSTLDAYKQLKHKFTLDHYSQGVMIISNEGNRIQDFKDIDLIIPFWFNSLVAVIDYCNTGKGEMTFQDRAGLLSLKKSYAGFLEIKKIHYTDTLIGTWHVSEDDFLLEIYSAAELFNNFLTANGFRYEEFESLLNDFKKIIGFS